MLNINLYPCRGIAFPMYLNTSRSDRRNIINKNSLRDAGHLRLPTMLCIALLLAIFIPGKNALSQKATLSSLEQDVLKYRHNLHRGHAIIEVTRIDGGRKKFSRIEAFFDGSKVRTNVLQTLRHTLPDGESKESRDLYKYAFTPEENLFHTDFQTKPGEPVAAYRDDVKLLNSETGHRVRKMNLTYRIDPRKLGIVPGDLGSLHSRGIQDILNRPDRKLINSKEINAGGHSTWMHEYQLNNGIKLKLEISPEHGPSVMAAELKFLSPRGATIIDRIDNILTQYGPDRIWFPESIRYFRSVNGVKGSESEFRILEAQFNINIDPELFTLAGMDIPKGTMVILDPPDKEGRTFFWDGTQLSTESQIQSRTLTDFPVASRFQRRWGWLITANLLFIAAIGFFAGYRFLSSHR